MPTSSRQTWLGCAAAIALVASAIAVVRHGGAHPVLASVEPGVGVGIPNDVGRDTTYGEIGLVAPDGQDVTLQSATLVPLQREGGMQVVEVVVAEPSRGRVRVSSGDGFPAVDLEGKTRQLRGAHVPRPGDKDWELGVELVFGLRAQRVGHWSFSGVELTYVADGHRGSQFVAAPLSFCAPLESTCEPPPPGRTSR
jgi:hypothetical protein